MRGSKLAKRRKVHTYARATPRITRVTPWRQSVMCPVHVRGVALDCSRYMYRKSINYRNLQSSKARVVLAFAGLPAFRFVRLGLAGLWVRFGSAHDVRLPPRSGSLAAAALGCASSRFALRAASATGKAVAQLRL